MAVWQRRRLSAYDLGVLALTLAGALRSGRGIVWFALAVAVLLPIALDGALGGDSGPVHRRIGIALSGGAVGLALVVCVATLLRPAAWFERTWPEAAVRAVERAASRRRPEGRVSQRQARRLAALEARVAAGPGRLRRSLRASHPAGDSLDRALQVTREGVGRRHGRRTAWSSSTRPIRRPTPPG